MKIFVKSIPSAALTLFVALASLSTPAFSQEVPEAASIPGVLPGFFVAGTPDPNGKVPALNAVSGSGVSNIAVADPQTILTHGKNYVYTIFFTDYNITGNYEVEYTLTQVVGSTTNTLQSGYIVKGKSFNPGEQWAWELEGPAIPDSPGLATLTGIVKYGTNFGTQVKISSKVVIQ